MDRAGREAGAEAVVGGHREGDRGYLVQPTILTNTSNEMKVVREEIFGPVVCAIPFDSVEEIVPVANDTNYGLAAGVFTEKGLPLSSDSSIASSSAFSSMSSRASR